MKDGTAVRWWAALDNHTPARATTGGDAVRTTSANGDPVIKLWPWGKLRDPHNAVYVVDDGRTAVAHYVTGWREDSGELWISPYPVNPDGATRPDNGEPVDYSTWSLGPRRSYHLKITSPA